MVPDSRQRAPFAHQSSSADLTSPQYLASLRSAPPQTQRNATSPTDSGPSASRYDKGYGLWGAPLTRKDSNDLTNGGYLDNPYSSPTSNPVYSLDTPTLRRRSLSNASSRPPSPRPFSLPQFSIPGIATIRFVSLCSLWYASSAVSSNTGKVILNNFPYPVTLTIVQFFFVALCCIICSRKELGWTGRLRNPTKAILRGTLPMAAFQVGGHIFSSLAISRVPVSTVHTIKALSPLVTVMAYAFLFGVSYSPATYLSLLPLTLGVMLACSFDVSLSNVFGLICAFGSTIIFVSQNIFFKKIVPTSGTSELGAAPKLDKINLLYFSSGMAFILMVPVWLWSDAGRLVELWLHPTTPKVGGPSVPFYFVLNGTVHFAQNLLAFAILSSTSPVTYSIASLVKRIAVICLAIIWFKQSVHGVQAVGIGLTGVGLWMYNNAKRDVEKGEKRMRQVEAVRDGLLPTTKAEQRVLEGRANLEPTGYGLNNGMMREPLYPDNPFADSTSSDQKMAGFRFPPSAPPQQAAPPYPSPPPSTSSSPPTEPHHLPGTRQSRTSNEARDHGDHFRLPPSSGGRASTINEHNGLDGRGTAASPMGVPNMGVVAGA